MNFKILLKYKIDKKIKTCHIIRYSLLKYVAVHVRLSLLVIITVHSFIFWKAETKRKKNKF